MEEMLRNEEGLHILQLPPEILKMIFDYLDASDKSRVSLVCAAFRDVAYHPALWQNVEATLRLEKSSETLYPSLVRRKIKRVRVMGKRMRGLLSLVRGIPHLSHLRIDCYNSLSDRTLCMAFQVEMPNLVSLELTESAHITNATVRLISTYLKNLESLALICSYRLTNWALLNITMNLQKLNRLRLGETKFISDKGIKYMCARDDAATPTGHLQLQNLMLSDCHMFTDNALKHLTTGMKSLQRVSLHRCSNFTDDGFAQMTTELVRLTDLHLCNCEISDVGLSQLTRSSRLTRLELGWCWNVTDAGFKLLANMSGLVKLKISSCDISDSGLIHLGQLVQLRALQLRSCQRITDRGIRCFLEKGAKSSLRLTSLDLSDCQGISNRALWYITMVLTSLRKLSLDQRLVDDDGMHMMAHNLQKLDVLHVGGRNRMGEIFKLRFW